VYRLVVVENAKQCLVAKSTYYCPHSLVKSHMAVVQQDEIGEWWLIDFLRVLTGMLNWDHSGTIIIMWVACWSRVLMPNDVWMSMLCAARLSKSRWTWSSPGYSFAQGKSTSSTGFMRPPSQYSPSLGGPRHKMLAREIATWTIYLRERLEDLRRCSMLFSDGHSYWLNFNYVFACHLVCDKLVAYLAAHPTLQLVVAVLRLESFAIIVCCTVILLHTPCPYVLSESCGVLWRKTRFLRSRLEQTGI